MVKEYESVSLFNSIESLILESITRTHSVVIFSKSELFAPLSYMLAIEKDGWKKVGQSC